MKKFYKIVDAGTVPGGYTVRLDGKPLRTPLKNPVIVEGKELADAIALEWAAQGDVIHPIKMPLTQLVNTMIDKARGRDRAEMEGMIVGYATSDLVCYFADHPSGLVKLHEEKWLPLIAWMKEKYGIVLEKVSGIQYHSQPESSVEKLKKMIACLSPADFTIVQAAGATTGSVVIALALMDGRLTPDEAYEAACVDEIYQLKTWGDDAEAQKRLDHIRSELESINRFKSMTRGNRSPDVPVLG